MKKIVFGVMVFSMLGFLSCSKGKEDPSKYQLLGWAVGSDYTGYGVILHTSDGGKNWTRQGDSLTIQTDDLSDICILDDKTILACGNLKANRNYTVLKTKDGGNTWYNVSSSVLLNVKYEGLFALNSSEVWLVGDSGSIFHSRDAGETWEKLAVPYSIRANTLNRVSALTSDNIWVVGSCVDGENQYPPMIHSMNGGISWDTLNPLGALNMTSAIGHYYLGIKVAGNSIWAIGGFGKFVIRSGDSGRTWSNISDPNAQGLCDANDIGVLNTSEAYVVSDYSGISYTNDFGASWRECGYNTGNWYVGIAILDNQNLWVTGPAGTAFGYSRIIYSSDGGLNWQDQTPQLLIDKKSITMYKIRFIRKSV